MILGKPIVKGSFSSSDVCKMFVTGKGPMPAVPDMCIGFVNVANVAEAHYKALITPAAAGRRFFLANKQGCNMLDVMQWSNSKYQPLGYPGFTKKMPKMPFVCL